MKQVITKTRHPHVIVALADFSVRVTLTPEDFDGSAADDACNPVAQAVRRVLNTGREPNFYEAFVSMSGEVEIVSPEGYAWDSPAHPEVAAWCADYAADQKFAGALDFLLEIPAAEAVALGLQ